MPPSTASAESCLRIFESQFPIVPRLYLGREFAKHSDPGGKQHTFPLARSGEEGDKTTATCPWFSLLGIPNSTGLHSELVWKSDWEFGAIPTWGSVLSSIAKEAETMEATLQKHPF
ncbi:hypothetical protein B0H34DRAFT_675069 [Crassisporium funariophilum]|nr:hypothetical protein B0H34DRAFT_675069 [Crassisporium funariophilum]